MLRSNCIKYFSCIRLTFTTIIYCLFFQNNSFSAEDLSLPSYEGEYGHWQVYTIEQNGVKTCYTTSTPTAMNGNHKSDRSPYIMVTIFGTKKQEISIVSGYFYRSHSVVSTSIDGKQGRFIAENDTIAWPEKIDSDRYIINDMINGFRMLVFAESNANTYSVDSYSLSGFKKAYNKIKELCN